MRDDQPELDLAVGESCSFSYDWLRAAMAFCLQHFNLLGPFKRHGFGTLVLLVGFAVCLEYSAREYFATKSGYLMALNYEDDLYATLYCNAVGGCAFEQEEACVAPFNLSRGENASIAASDCQWTVRVLCASDFDSKRTAFALLNVVGDEVDLQDFPVMEQETLRQAQLSKTIDETTEPAHESWSLNVWSSFRRYGPCAAYGEREDVVCAAFDILFDQKVYTISRNDQVALVNILSGAMWAWLLLAILVKVALSFFDMASALHQTFGPKND